MKPLFTHPFVDTYHRHLDDVGSSALNRGIDGISLCITAHHSVARIDVRQLATATQQGLCIAQLTGFLDALVHVFLHAWIGGKIVVNKLSGFASAYFHTFSQSKGRDAVDDAEIGRLCLATHCAGHILDIHLEDLGSCRLMNIVPAVEVFDHVLVLAEMSHQTQFYLAVIG